MVETPIKFIPQNQLLKSVLPGSIDIVEIIRTACILILLRLSGCLERSKGARYKKANRSPFKLSECFLSELGPSFDRILMTGEAARINYGRPFSSTDSVVNSNSSTSR